MATEHNQHGQSILDVEEHSRIGGIDGKKMFVFDNAGNQIIDFGGGTSNATVDVRNTINANVSLGASAQFIGIVTVANPANTGNTTLNPGPNQIGSVTISHPINANVSLSNSIANIGFATVNISNAVGNATLNPSPNFIGLVSTASVHAKAELVNSVANVGFATVKIASNVNTNIGLVTVAGGTMKSLVSLSNSVSNIGFATVAVASAATVFAVVNTSAAGQSSVVLDTGENFIGIVSVANKVDIDLESVRGINIDSDPLTTDTAALTGVAVGSFGRVFNGGSWERMRRANTANATTGIGLLGAGVLGFDGTNYRRLITTDDGILRSITTITNTINANVSLGASPAFIGIVTVANPSAFTGNVTLDDGSLTGIVGNVTLSDAKTFIGLTTTTLGASTAGIGFATVALGSGIGNIGFATVKIASNVNTNIGLVTVDGGTVKSLVSLSNSVSNIGFATVNNAAGAAFIGLATVIPAYLSNSTVFAQVISLTSTTTICVAPASNFFFIKNLHVSSLGRSEVEIRSGATTLIPFTSLSTTSGFFEHYGENGLPGRTTADGLVVNLAVGSATISVMANVRFGV